MLKRSLLLISVALLCSIPRAEWLAAPDAVRLAGSEAYIFFAAKQIEQFEKHPKRLDLTPPAEPLAGPPIGELGLEDEYMFAISGRSPER